MQAARTQKAWRVQLLAELQFTRYQLRPHALEVFFSDHTNALLSFLNAQVGPPPTPGIRTSLVMQPSMRHSHSESNQLSAGTDICTGW